MITATRLRKLLRYNKRTGWFYWRVNRNSVVRKNMRAGSLHKHGYRQLKIDNRLYKEHRLVWLYVTGAHCSQDVDHRNLKKADNRWINLREGNDSLNQANTAARKDNTSGFKSVHQRENGRYRVRIQVRGKRYSLGDFSCPKQAHAAYSKAAKKHFGEFARAA